jgi:hypothetical protein
MSVVLSVEIIQELIKFCEIKTHSALDEVVAAYKSNDSSYLEFLGDRYFALFLTEELHCLYEIEDIQYLFSHFNSNAAMNKFMAYHFEVELKHSSDILEIFSGCLRICKFSMKIFMSKFVAYIQENMVIYDIRTKSRSFNRRMHIRKKVTSTKTFVSNFRTSLKVWCDVNSVKMESDTEQTLAGHLAKVKISDGIDNISEAEFTGPNPDDALEMACYLAGKTLELFHE